MASVGDIIEVKSFQTLENIAGDVLNVFHFEVTAVGGAPIINNMGADFVLWFYSAYVANVQLMQSASLFYNRIEVNNLMAYETEFGVFDAPANTRGSVNVAYNSPAAAWSFEFVRLFRTTRNGSKRFAGVPESLVDNNVIAGSAITSAAAAAAALEAEQEVGEGGATISMRPVIIRKPLLVTTPPTVINPVANVVFRGLGSQNSRKQLL